MEKQNYAITKAETANRLFKMIDNVIADYKTRETAITADLKRCLAWREKWVDGILKINGINNILRNFNPDSLIGENIPLKGLYGMMDFLESYGNKKFHGAQARTLITAIAVIAKNGYSGVFARDTLKYDVVESNKILAKLNVEPVKLISLGTQLSSVMGKKNLLKIFGLGSYDVKTKKITLNQNSAIIKQILGE